MSALIGLAHGGGPAHPHDWWRAWSADPVVLAGLLIAAGAYAIGLRRLRAEAGRRVLPSGRTAAFAAGVVALVVALVSPVDRLGEALFSAHMAQHLLLMVVAPPLLVLAAPGYVWLWSLPPDRRRRVGAWWHRTRLRPALATLGGHPLAAWALQAVALALWHIPFFYDAAVRHETVHALEHASFLGTAILFWSSLLHPARRLRAAYGAGVLAVFGAAMQGGALGALLTFASRPWYRAHLETAPAWSLSPLADQHVAGAIMWVAGGIAYALVLALLILLWLRAAERGVRARERRALRTDALPMRTAAGPPGG